MFKLELDAARNRRERIEVVKLVLKITSPEKTTSLEEAVVREVRGNVKDEREREKVGPSYYFIIKINK